MDRHLAQLRLREASPLVGLTVREALEGSVSDDAVEAVVDVVDAGESLPTEATVEQVLAVSGPLDVDVLQIDRDGESFFATATDRPLEPGDVLTVRGTAKLSTISLRRLTFGTSPVVRSATCWRKAGTRASSRRPSSTGSRGFAGERLPTSTPQSIRRDGPRCPPRRRGHSRGSHGGRTVRWRLTPTPDAP